MYLNLNPSERRICYLLFWGYSEADIAADLGATCRGVQALLFRARRREFCSNTMILVCRYADEYLGVGEAFGERPLPVRAQAAAA